jgi:1,4-dihydroxy-2-naphthoate octaprenyltransferase
MASINLRPWISAARPKTLGAAIAPVILGFFIGYCYSTTDHFKFYLLLYTLLSALCIQIATNFFNDAIDCIKGADTNLRLGPTRAAASQQISPNHLFIAAACTLALACIFAVPLIQIYGWIIIVIGIPSLYLSYGYTGGAFPLAYLGLGEIFVFLFFGLIAVNASCFIQCGYLLPQSWICGTIIGLASCNLIAINNYRDAKEDILNHKKTLSARFGDHYSKIAISIFTLLPLCIWWHFSRLQWLPHSNLSYALLIPAQFILKDIWSLPVSRHLNRTLALAGVYLLLMTLLFCLLMTLNKLALNSNG